MTPTHLSFRSLPLQENTQPSEITVGKPTEKASHWKQSPWYQPAIKLAVVVTCLVSFAIFGVIAQTRISRAASNTHVAVALPPSPTETPHPPTPEPPKVSGTSPLSSSSAPEKEKPAPSGVLPDGRVVLNLATEKELQKLPKIGAKRARSIVELRKRLGKFRSFNDLRRVRGIGRKTLQRLQPLMVLNPPKNDSPPK
jgi:competence protein ComEA